MISGPDNDNPNSICVYNTILYVYVNGATTETEARAVLDANPPSLVYKLATPTIETYEAPSGYKAWNGGLQAQLTDDTHVPYAIIQKQYAISAKSQILNNATINVNQQRQIDVNKANIKANKQAIAGKQATLSDAQLKAVNSGITDEKVKKYDSYAADISGSKRYLHYLTIEIPVSVTSTPHYNLGKIYFTIESNSEDLPSPLNIENLIEYFYEHVFNSNGGIIPATGIIRESTSDDFCQVLQIIWARKALTGTSKQFNITYLASPGGTTISIKNYAIIGSSSTKAIYISKL